MPTARVAQREVAFFSPIFRVSLLFPITQGAGVDQNLRTANIHAMPVIVGVWLFAWEDHDF